jgi:UbiD family decarboxylase
MGYRDMREHIQLLEKEGELKRIKKEVDWDVELGAIMRRVFKEKGPAVFFEKVKGSNIPVFSGAMFGHKKYSLMIDSKPDINSMLRKMVDCIDHPINPLMVSSGVCQENVFTGDKINLEMFPSPKWHHLDGGRFIGTLGAVITKDPETGIRNVAVYREQQLSKNKIGLNPTQDANIHLQKYRTLNKSMPVATCIGVPPAVLAASVTKARFGQDEMGIAGAIAGEPIPMVKCRTIDLEVPADSEIVLEGEIPMDSKKWELEGPFGEFTGHFNSLEKHIRPTIFLSAVTYRSQPIYQGCSPGLPPNEETTCREIGNSAGVWHRLQKSGIPGIKEAYLTEMGCAGFVVIVSMDRHYYMGNVRQIIYYVLSTFLMAKWVIVVDDDVDIHDMGAVQWALSTRVQPHRDIFVTDDKYWGVTLDPSIHPNNRYIPNNRGSRIGIDATKYFKGYDFPPLVLDSRETEERINQNWKSYGF